MKKQLPVVLMILDGWGISKQKEGNAIAQGDTSNMDRLLAQYPHSQLLCSGEAVGLPDGQQGNSEVGHLNLGAGRVVYQELTRINKAVREHTLQDNAALQTVMDACIAEQKPLHLMGLVSPGGVHSHSDHLYGILEMARDKHVPEVYVHCFLDGRDVGPTTGLGFVQELESVMQRLGIGKIATVSGRYYAMDRDNRWERVEKAYLAMTEGIGAQALCATDAVKQSYALDVTDEFVLPTVIQDEQGQPISTIHNGDGVIFFNFRGDRAREITKAFVNKSFDGFEREYLGVQFVAMTQYEDGLDVTVAFPPQELHHTLGQVLAEQQIRQFRVAETEKYAHVTFFFNGGVEEANPLEDRLLVPSPKVATYDLQPEMSAVAVKTHLIAAIESGDYPFLLVNFANADMVGHTGILEAAQKAVETVDACIGEVVQAVRRVGGVLLITADHGNAEQMIDLEKGTPHTAHTANVVPFIVVSAYDCAVIDGALQDVAPTVLQLLGIEKPIDMTGCSLIKMTGSM